MQFSDLSLEFHRIVCCAAAAVLTVGVLLIATAAHPQECGDVVGNSDGVKTSDALAVLRKSIGQDVQLDCTSGECQSLEQRTEDIEAGTLTVRDGPGNILGRLVRYDFFTWDIYVPQLGIIVRLIPKASEVGGVPAYGLAANEVYYSDALCSGLPWAVQLWDGVPPNLVIAKGRTFVPTTLKRAPHVSLAKLGTSGTCTTTTATGVPDGENAGAFYLEEVTLPFDFPILGPLTVGPLR